MFDNILYLLLCGYLSTAGLIKQPCKPVERQWHMGSYIYIDTYIDNGNTDHVPRNNKKCKSSLWESITTVLTNLKWNERNLIIEIIMTKKTQTLK